MKRFLKLLACVLAPSLLVAFMVNASGLVKPATTNSKMPVKGDLITIDGMPYRVLKVDGTVAEVLSLNTYSDSYLMFNSSTAAVANVYAGSTVDKYCNETFYWKKLSNDVRKAIVDCSPTGKCP